MGNVYIGDSKQEVPVLFDTGSPMVYVLTDSCEEMLCPQIHKFEAHSSGTFKENSDGNKDELAHCYGKGCVNGFVSKDNFCFIQGADRNACVATTFLAVNQATDIEKDKFSGIIGLGPKSDVSRLPAFIEQASGLGGVGGGEEVSPLFSFYLTNTPEKSGTLTLGGYNLAKFAAPGTKDKDIFWADMAHKQTFFWTLRMGDLSFNDGKKFNSSSRHMILDSGLSYALIPSADF